MKDIRIKALVVLITAMLLVSVTPAFAVTPHPANAMWIEPTSVSLTTANPLYTIGYLFNVTLYVNVSTTQLIGAWQAKVLFDPTQLQVVALGLTKGTQSEWLFGKSTFHPDPTVDNTTGYVLDGESMVGPSILSPGSGSLDWITFNVTKVPPKSEALSSVIDITTTYPGKTYVLDDSEKTIVMTTSNCNYSFTWEAPPSPSVEVSPSTPIVFGPNPPSAVGQAFPVEIYVRNLAQAWGMVNASFTLSFNTTLIDIVGPLSTDNVSIPAFWQGPNTVTKNHPQTPYDNVTIFVQNPTSTPSGDVLLATITFTVMHQLAAPPAPSGFTETSPLHLSDIVLWDAPDQIIPVSSTVDGEVRIIALRLLELAWLEVNPPSVTMGPTPVVGQTFSVDIVCKGLDRFWFATAYQFRVLYNHTFLDVASVTEGPMWQRKTGADDEWTNKTSVDLANPVGSRWNTYVIDAWTDRDLSGNLTVGDWIDIHDVAVVPNPPYDDHTWVVTSLDTTCKPYDMKVSVQLWNLYGTFFINGNEYDPLFDYYGTGQCWNVYASDMLLPGTGGWDMPEFPNCDNVTGDVLATITFVVTKQLCPYNYTSGLNIIAFMSPPDLPTPEPGLPSNDGHEAFLDKDGNYIDTDYSKYVHGSVTVIGNYPATGRVIDVYGGAKNDGYWAGYPAAFSSTWGGQGLGWINETDMTFHGAWMDLVFPQSEVTLYANLTYNFWPIQSKEVGFEIEGPYTKLPNGTLVPSPRWYILAKYTATTDENGVAKVTFRMPWPCDDPDSITGIWKVTATATVADVEIKDVLIFYYERPLYITKVTTDKYSYLHGETVVITILYHTHSVQTYPALFSAVLTDDLGVPVGIALIQTTIGGAVFCTWKDGKVKLSIEIPKYAYAGYGYVHVNCFDKDPTEGGEPYVKEYRDVPPVLYPSGHLSDIPEIQINPY